MAHTVAAKRRAKKMGRPRKEGFREPNGRLSRSGRDHEPADVVALSVRARHTGLPIEAAKDQKAATFIGCLNILGRVDGLSDEQYAAAVSFTDLRASYLRAIKAPNALADNGVIGSSGDEISQAYEDWSRRTRQRYEECRHAIQEAQNDNRHANLWAALDYCIIQDQRFHHMIGDLRILCNALARFFKCG